MILKKIKDKVLYYWHRRNGNAYLEFLRKNGIAIGEGTRVRYPLTIEIDITRPELIEIGDNVLLHRNLTILTHDYASRVFVNLYGDFIPSHKKIKIGNNVWFGENCAVLKGVTIGDNCIIGYGSTVLKDIPPYSVAVGCPAKVICSLEEYYNKRKNVYIDEIFEYAFEIERKKGREPVAEDFYDDYPIFVDRRNISEYKYPYSNVFSSKEMLDKWLKIHTAPFCGFNEFINEYRKRKRQLCIRK